MGAVLDITADTVDFQAIGVQSPSFAVVPGGQGTLRSIFWVSVPLDFLGASKAQVKDYMKAAMPRFNVPCIVPRLTMRLMQRTSCTNAKVTIEQRVVCLPRERPGFGTWKPEWFGWTVTQNKC